MRSKKLIIPLLLVGGVAFFTLQSLTPPPPATFDFEQHPPVVEGVRVQKISSATGANLQMKIQYKYDLTLPTSIDLYLDDVKKVTFYDDGATSGDLVANDKIFTGQFVEDITSFKNDINDKITGINAQGGVVRFDGHLGTKITSVSAFNEVEFDLGNEVSIDLNWLAYIHCTENGIKKQNSLFITDIKVVEDAARTQPDPGNGNALGAWQFGTLIRNIAEDNPTAAKDMLRDMLERWTVPGDLQRMHVFRHLIGPWLHLANISNTGSPAYAANFYTSFDDDLEDPNVPFDWDANVWDVWEETPAVDLLRTAPFKLTAIVNRIDLHGNMAYVNTPSNAGEVRFIFTLTNPFNTPPDGRTAKSPVGTPVRGGDGARGNNGCDDVNDLVDWMGMNVIFEYGIPYVAKCHIMEYAHGWKDLSQYDLENPTQLETYLEKLQLLTDVVTKKHSNLARITNNKSAINRIRTNERIFFPSLCGAGNDPDWEASDWELSQFELSGGTLVSAPVTNTPANLNEPYNLMWNNTTFAITGDNNGYLEWIWQNKVAVAAGNHMMPSWLLDPTAIMKGDQTHYFEVKWETAANTSGQYPGFIHNPANEYPEFKTLRRQISVNTCQGCHGGETKTLFTHVRPMPLYQDAKYWSSNTAEWTVTGKQDSRFHDNKQYTKGISTAPPGGVRNYVYPPFPTPPGSQPHKIDHQANRYYPTVSAFLTGRTFGGDVGSGNYNDDYVDATVGGEDSEDALLSNLTLFYVNDPSNVDPYSPEANGDETRIYPSVVAPQGYNDLAMRVHRLCNLTRRQCRFTKGSVSITLLEQITVIPLPKGAH